MYSTQLNTLFSPRTLGLLRRIGVKSLDALATKSAKDLEFIRGCGPTTLREVRDVLADHDLALAGEQADPLLAKVCKALEGATPAEKRRVIKAAAKLYGE